MDGFGGLLSGFQIGPIWLLIGGLVGGIIIREKFPAIGNFMPSLFKPTPSTDSLVDSIVDKVVDKLNKK